MIIILKNLEIYGSISCVNINGDIVDFNTANATDSSNSKARMTGQTGDNGVK